MLETARQAQKYAAKVDEDEQVEASTEKWRDAGAKAATYLYNQAAEKVDRMGGMEEYMRRQKEREEFNNSGFEDEIDVDELTPEQRERYEELKEEYEEQMNSKKLEEGEAEEAPSEFTMKYMLKSIQVNPDILFPNGF